ncbi:MAG TPA: VOC family protein [Steroidobacteraceae bacterium]|nr:VOC family protein [Steroidobacteraceae bacterium]
MTQRRFGPIVQMGYVVPDIEQAIDHWTRTFGVGPWFLIEHTPFTELKYRGKPVHVDQSAALAQWDDMQIELVQQHNEVRCVNTDFAGRERGGLQHLGVMCDSVEREMERLARDGVEAIQWGAVDAIRFAFLDTGQHDGLIVELIEDGPAIREFFAMVRDAARDWDGSEPLRRVSLV